MQNTFKLKSREEELRGLRQQLGQLLDGSGLTPREAEDVILTVDEALTNTLEHGYGHEEGRINDTLDRVEILIRDFGRPFDPTGVPTPKLPPTGVGGLGVHFIRSTMDNVEYVRSPDEANERLLTKTKSASRSSSGT